MRIFRLEIAGIPGAWTWAVATEEPGKGKDIFDMGVAHDLVTAKNAMHDACIEIIEAGDSSQHRQQPDDKRHSQD